MVVAESALPRANLKLLLPRAHGPEGEFPPDGCGLWKRTRGMLGQMVVGEGHHGLLRFIHIILVGNMTVSSQGVGIFIFFTNTEGGVGGCMYVSFIGSR